jgi:pyruvoyl-dependent arginine decarboxylase (PvlArgDC)
MLRELIKGSVPKIPTDIPKNMWGIICECLNPFTETRLEAKELLERYAKVMLKMKIPELLRHLGKFLN